MKSTLKDIAYHATLCIGVAFFISSSLFGMDGSENKDVALLPEDGVIILSLLKECLNYFDHYTLCSLAINKEWDKLLKDTAPQRKLDLMVQTPSFAKAMAGTAQQPGNEVLGNVWHKYGSAWAKVISKTNEPRLVLELICFGYKHCLHAWMGSRCHNYISNIVQPRFNENGKFKFYVLEEADRKDFGPWLVSKPRNCYRQIVEHSCSVSTFSLQPYSHESVPMYVENSKSIELLMHKDHFGDISVNLIDFLSFPVFFNACINALAERDNNQGKVCDLQNVCLSSGYKKCVPHDQCQFKSYVELPEWWREIIDKRYNEQQKDKKL